MSEVKQRKESNDKVRQRQRRALLITLVTFVVAFVATAYLTLESIQEKIPHFTESTNALSGVLAIISLIALFFILRRKVSVGVAFLLAGFAYTFLTTTLFFSGTDIILSILSLFVFFGISSTTLPAGTERRLGISLMVLLPAGILLINFFEPFERTFYPPDAFTFISSLVLILLFGILIGQEFPYYPVRTKLALSFVFLSALGIGLAFTIENSRLRNTLDENAKEKLLANSSATASNIDAFLRYNIELLNASASYLDFRAYLLLDENERTGTEIERRVQNFLFTLNNKNAETISYGLLDKNGKNISDSNTRIVGTDESNFDYFSIPIYSGGSYISSPLYLPDEKEAVFFVSVPVYDDMGGSLGILRVKYKASALQSLLKESKKITEEGAFSVLLDQNHIILAHEADESLVGKIVYQPSQEEFQNMQAQYLLQPNRGITELAYNFPEIQKGLDNVSTSPYFSTPVSALEKPIIGAVVQLSGVGSPPWLVVTAQPQAFFLGRAQQQTQRALLFSLALIVISAIFGLWISNVIVAPILHLEENAQEFTQGNLDVRSEVDTDDEIGSLSTTFNALANQLSNTIRTLEEQVEIRTKDLALRSTYLERVANVSRIATSLTDTDELSRRIVNLIQEEFNLYYVGLFLTDSNEEWAVLKAGTGEAGKIMLEQNHRLKIGEGMIGWAVKYGESRIALDVGEDAVRFNNPLLPETRSEGALPLRARGRVLGALTIQSDQPEAFTPEIIATLQIMADQIAVAFENAELFERREAALQAERIAYGQLSHDDWLNILQRKPFPSYIADAENRVKTKNYQTEAQKRQIHARPILEDQGLTALIPISVRGLTLGTIKLKKPAKAGQWTKDQIELAEALANEVSIALESARLFDQSQRQAAQEHIIGQAAARMRESLDINRVLKIATEELHKALGQVETEIWINPDSNPTTEEESIEKEAEK